MAPPKAKPRPAPRRNPVSRRNTRNRSTRLCDAHHQIKNSLQGIAGLLGLHAARRPEIAGALQDAIHQIHAVAHVYGLHASDGDVRLSALVDRVVAGLRLAIPVALRFDAISRGRDWTLPEREAVPIAMVANELICHAIKHRDPSTREEVAVSLRRAGHGEAFLQVRYRGSLPKPGSLASPEADTGGLDLVRSLLPPGASALALKVEDGWVRAELRLRPPAVRPPRR